MNTVITRSFAGFIIGASFASLEIGWAILLTIFVVCVVETGIKKDRADQIKQNERLVNLEDRLDELEVKHLKSR